MGQPLVPEDKLRRTVTEVQRAQLDALGYRETARWRFLTSIPASRQQTLEALGQGVHEAQQAAVRQAGTLAQIRSRLLAPPRRRRGFGPWVWAFAGSTSVAAVALLVVVALPESLPESQPSESQPTLTFTVDKDPGQVGQQLAAASAEKPVTMRFSDRSVMQLERGASLKVLDLRPTGARVMLEQGGLRVQVAPRRHSNWSINVGPFEVHVRGTQFRVSWDPSSRRFNLEMHKGRVELRGPVVGRRDFSRGQAVEVRVDEEHLAVRRTADAVDPAPVSPTVSPPVDHADAPATASRQPRPTVEPTRPPATPIPPVGSAPAGAVRIAPEAPAVPAPEPATDTPSTTQMSATADQPAPAPPGPVQPSNTPRVASPRPWELASAGAYAEAVRAGDRLGWPSLMASAGAPQLIVLAGAARSQGRVDLAVELLTTVRQRFAGSPAAAQAAYTRGCVAFHQQRKPQAAARWFRIYLGEQPAGPLAREAQGRLVESLHRARLSAQACAAAQAYLAAHPQGPHAPFARTVKRDCAAKGSSGDAR